MHFQLIDMREAMASRELRFQTTGRDGSEPEITEAEMEAFDDAVHVVLDAEAPKGFYHDYGAEHGIDFPVRAR